MNIKIGPVHLKGIKLKKALELPNTFEIETDDGEKYNHGLLILNKHEIDIIHYAIHREK